MIWRARLAGDAFDLQRMVEVFGEGDPVVYANAEGHYILESSFFDSLEDVAAVNESAAQILTQMNGVVTADDLSAGSVQLSGDFWDENGPQVLARALTANIRARGHVVIQGTHSPPPPAREWYRISQSNRNVADALELLGASYLGPVTLYKIWEIIRDDVGSSQLSIHSLGWTTRNESSRFKSSVNHQEVSGVDARHARSKTLPPSNPMALSDAQAFIQPLVRNWLQWCVAGRPKP